MTWRILLSSKAERDLRRLPKSDAQRIKGELDDLAEEPLLREYVKKLKGRRSVPLYSYRVGRYRIILAIEDDAMVIFVIEVGDRSTVYRTY